MLVRWLLLLALSSPLLAADFHAYTEELPPLNYLAEQQPQGFSVELLQLLAKQAGVSISIEVLPWARAVEYADKDPHGILFTITRTPERENRYLWLGPISDRKIILLRLANRGDIKLSNLDDARQYVIGATRESASAKKLQQSGFVIEKSLDLAPNDQINLRKLMAGRNDMIAILDWAAAWQAKSIGANLNQFTQALILDNSLDYYFALNRNADPELVRRLNQAFSTLQKSGQLDKLRQRYFHQDP
ncbi:transporter substrate-binding domain-containing protein [Chitinibacter fontanus]|uniref:Transporter substrate-binding domain-containing protein n=1 Tax=Chitinibacter fontanus TaxID=1737446 RepID=A0A7D5ZDR0_9NEIS|nr:transporter substrate-binding domain-containing protein [Chitinibacter fontanus]QLI81264.1 transporter substrate-binding domain-containing protein [Chitinibacter fontanus]